MSPSKKAAIAAQMKALRSQIDNDFHSMTHYGKEVRLCFTATELHCHVPPQHTRRSMTHRGKEMSDRASAPCVKAPPAVCACGAAGTCVFLALYRLYLPRVPTAVPTYRCCDVGCAMDPSRSSRRFLSCPP